MLESELLSMARDGDEKALENILLDNYKLVFGYIIRLCNDEEIAKDLTQETMTRAILKLHSFRGGCKFSTWLITIASNLFKDGLRRKQGHSLYNDIEEMEITSDVDVEASIIRSQAIKEINIALSKMNHNMRKAFILKHYYNYSYEDIAQILRCPVGTVRSRIHYCIEKLRTILKGGE